jgi:23S rRNA (guanosine2251-2'-O)-methyltransferase
MKDLVLIAHDVRSTHNVGSLFRTAEGLGVKFLWLTGYTPYPIGPNDKRMPHIAIKINNQIKKTALGAENLINWQQSDVLEPIIQKLRSQNYKIVALEQSANSVKLQDYKSPAKVALVVGNEVEGLSLKQLNYCDKIVEIPMQGKKESLNVVQATAIALYHITFSKL